MENTKKNTSLWKSLRASFTPDEYPTDFEYKKFFFKLAHALTLVLFFLGLTAAILVFILFRNPFKSLAIIFLSIWFVVFLRYFLWAVYHYNVNYGLSIKDWERIKDARERLQKGEAVLKEELVEPKYNPYRSQTFGVPPGTVRGMLAFTLLFGAIAILIASMGMDQVDLENSLIRDQFEFFKTAFLMMMAFYFGDKSLKFLQTRWKDPNTSVSPSDPEAPEEGTSTSEGNTIKGKQQAGGQVKAAHLTGMLSRDDKFLREEDAAFAGEEGLPTHLTEEITTLKKNMNTLSFVTPSEAMVDISELEGKDDFLEDGQMTCNHPCTPIIDAGHGGIIDGVYTTGIKKRYRFEGTKKDFEILEGVINRKIAKKLIDKLEEHGLPYYNLNVNQEEDMPLPKRVVDANQIYSKDKSAYFLSIHSNAASPSLRGKGGRGNGFEVWTSKGETPSDILAKIAKKEYLKSFADQFKFRGVKERHEKQKDLYVLANTVCPAILVENLFFDNHSEALYLDSDKGQDAIAECLLNVVKSIHYYYED